jgi:hypothetical protein
MDTEDHIAKCLYDLNYIQNEIAALKIRQQELEEEVITMFSHTHEGQKTYRYGQYDIKIKTPFVYTLNKRLYESGQYFIPEECNPIKVSLKYDVNKRLCDQFMEYAPETVRDALAELIDKKPGKPSVTVTRGM